MMETGSNDDARHQGKPERCIWYPKDGLVPFLDGQVIKKVDLATRTIEVDWDPRFKFR